ncbi:MAG: hypothetical protein HKN70_09325 [Gammaproteobacteria bacterium]|nr:hypothetical protein [Gammaproteobacteria bacterium]
MTISRLNRIGWALALSFCIAVPLATANSQERGKGRGGPPQEAFAVCADKVEGDACSFSGRRGDAAGTCIVPPRGNESLVCAPERGSRPPGPRDEGDDTDQRRLQ